MVVFWNKAVGVVRSVIRRFLDKSRKQSYRNYWRHVNEQDWVKDSKIDVQEHPDGLWVEVLFNEVDDDREDGVSELDSDEASEELLD